MKARDIMSNDVKFVAPNASVVEVAKMMVKENVGCIPVCQNDKVLGIITDRDITMRVVAQNKDLNQTQAQQIMSADPVFIDENQSIDQAAELMAEYQIKRLPVVKNEKIVGIIALGDLAIEQISMDEAGEALSGISQGIRH